jgi:hypothetical protein
VDVKLWLRRRKLSKTQAVEIRNLNVKEYFQLDEIRKVNTQQEDYYLLGVTLCNLINHCQYFRECTKQCKRDTVKLGYSNIGFCDTLSIASNIQWYALIPHKVYSFITTLFLGPFDDVITKFYCISIKDRISSNQTHSLIFRSCLLQISTGSMAMLMEVSVVFLSPSRQMPRKYFDQTTNVSFHILSNSSAIQQYIL